MKNFFITSTIVGLMSVSGFAADENSMIDQKVETLLETMDVPTKIRMLTGVGFSLGTSLEGTDNFIPGVAGYTWSLPEYELPSMLLADGPAGIRFAEPRLGEKPDRIATAFPIASAAASTWDESLIEKMGRAMGREARAYGIDFILAPGMNLQRDPLGGRNYEYYSEDPLLSGKMAAAAVRGIQSTGVGATLKHFVANNQETFRTTLDTVVDQKTLRELYLRGFEIAVKEGKPAAIMTAYNLLNGVHTSQSAWLNKEVLREQWGFGGIVMTDWFAGDDPSEQILAGHNLLMPGTDRDRASIEKSFDAGLIDEALLNAALRPTLEAIVRTESLAIEPFDPIAHATLAQQIASDGIVLLSNDGALPLGKGGKNLAVFGVGAYETVSGGTGSGDVAESYTVSIASGLEIAGFALDAALAAPFEAHIANFNANLPARRSIFDPKPRLPEMAVPENVITAAALKNEAAIVVLSRLAGEFVDREIDADFNLTTVEKNQIESISKIFRARGKPVIVVLNVAGPIELASWQKDVNAVLLAWMGGQEAGSAVAEVITGLKNPSGRLPQSWPNQYESVSTAAFFPGKPTSKDPVPAYAGLAQSLPSKVVYGEKGRVGYRDINNRDNTLYEFGFGLSYTTFGLDLTSTSAEKDHVAVSARVSNSGKVPGRTVVQVYVTGPEDGDVPQLATFGKTGMLAPYQQELLERHISLRSLSRFDAESGEWVLPVGQYEIAFGFSSTDIIAQKSLMIKEELRFAP